MGRPLKLKAFVRILKRFGIAMKQGKKSTHRILTKTIDGEKRIYTIAIKKGEILPVYVDGVRKAFDLTPEHGVSDEDFYGK